MANNNNEWKNKNNINLFGNITLKTFIDSYIKKHIPNRNLTEDLKMDFKGVSLDLLEINNNSIGKRWKMDDGTNAQLPDAYYQHVDSNNNNSNKITIKLLL